MAPRGNKNAVGNKGGGAPTKYLPIHTVMATRAAELGLTDHEIAKALGICEGTIHAWKLEHPEFAEALKVGKLPADHRVERALFMRAVGYTYRAQKVVTVDKSVQVVDYDAYVPPSTTAGIFWLKNRRPDLWRDVQQFEHVATELEKIPDNEITERMAQAASELAAFERAKKKGNGVAANGKGKLN